MRSSLVMGLMRSLGRTLPVSRKSRALVRVEVAKLDDRAGETGLWRAGQVLDLALAGMRPPAYTRLERIGGVGAREVVYAGHP